MRDLTAAISMIKMVDASIGQSSTKAPIREKFPEFRQFSEIGSQFEMWRAAVRISDDRDGRDLRPQSSGNKKLFRISYEIYRDDSFSRDTKFRRKFRPFPWIRKLCLYIIKVIASRLILFRRINCVCMRK